MAQAAMDSRGRPIVKVAAVAGCRAVATAGASATAARTTV
nr:MAG TPA: hypothetical protein [Microviridae sp.]